MTIDGETSNNRPPTAWDEVARSSGQRIWWGVTLVLVGAAWLLVSLDVPIPWDLVLPIALIVVGVLVLAIGHRGVGDGLVGLGIFLAVGALLISWVPGTLSLTAGERELHYERVAQLDDAPALGAGNLTIDLRDVPFPAGVSTFEAGVTFGELVVLLPPDITVTGSADVAVGEVEAFGSSDGGIARSHAFDEPADGEAVVELDLGVAFGTIEVRR